MIIDGVKVLYTMRNGKIVDPNIPMDGLVCYLDARGKYNTDIYRDTLLDLSGNGNHGTLQNFNFTEESGYVKGLSDGGVSGLQFDGVDDNLGIREFMPKENPFTSLIEFELSETASEQKASVYLGFGAYIHKANDFLFIPWSSSRAVGSYIAKNTNYKLVTASDGTFVGTDIFINGEKKTIIVDYTTDLSNRIGFLLGKKIIKKVMVWNKKLNETEIAQLTDNAT